MASKIYKKGVFLVIEDTVSGNLKEFNTADVQIVKRNASLDVYEVLVLGVSQLKVNLDDIQNESGSAYSENDWDVFRFNEVGVVNTSNTSTVTTTTTVDITSAQILAMGTTPIELLPAAGVGKYYDIEKIILEYTAGTAYDFSTDFPYISMGNIQKKINPLLFFDATDYVGVVNALDTAIDVTNEVDIMGVMALNENLKITSWNGTDPTLGDGTLRAIITYTTRTFGA